MIYLFHLLHENGFYIFPTMSPAVHYYFPSDLLFVEMLKSVVERPGLSKYKYIIDI